MIKNVGSRASSWASLVFVAVTAMVALRFVGEVLLSAGTGPIGIAFLLICAVPWLLLLAVLALVAGIASCFDRREETRAWLEEQRQR